jgi:phosphoribosylglycinamide formyltransferase-1
VKKSRIAIFASGSGTNAEAIMSFFQHHASVEVVLLLTNNPDAMVLERVKRFHIPAKIFAREQFGDEVLTWLKEANVTHIVLAGFLLLMPPSIIHAFSNKIINIHPSLLPKFSGKGMYGMKIHEAVRVAAEKETGITIHLVNENYDEGEILFQTSCEIDSTDSSDDIARKVHKLEYEHFPEIIESFVSQKQINEGNPGVA